MLWWFLLCPWFWDLAEDIFLQWFNQNWVLILRHSNKRWLHRVFLLERSPPVKEASTVKTDSISITISGHNSPMTWFCFWSLKKKYWHGFKASTGYSWIREGGLLLSYLYLQTRWWMKMEISSLARLIPGHMRGPLPNPKKLKGRRVACSWLMHYFSLWGWNERNKEQINVKQMELTSNLDGLKVWGSGKTSGSWWIETTSKFRDQPFLIWYPDIFIQKKSEELRNWALNWMADTQVSTINLEVLSSFSWKPR